MRRHIRVYGRVGIHQQGLSAALPWRTSNSVMGKFKDHQLRSALTIHGELVYFDVDCKKTGQAFDYWLS